MIDHQFVFLWIGKVAALVTGLGTIWKFVGAPLWTYGKTLGTLPAKVDALTAQLQRNGGSTLRDAIERIEVLTARTEQRDRILLGLVPYGVIEYDSTGNCIMTNRTLLRWAGREEREIIGEGWLNTIDEDERERVIRDWQRAVAGKRNFESSFHIVNIDADTRVYVTCKTVPMYPGLRERELPFGYLAIIHREEEECSK